MSDIQSVWKPVLPDLTWERWGGGGLRASREYRQSLAAEGKVGVSFREGGEGLRSFWLSGGPREGMEKEIRE